MVGFSYQAYRSKCDYKHRWHTLILVQQNFNVFFILCCLFTQFLFVSLQTTRISLEHVFIGTANGAVVAFGSDLFLGSCIFPRAQRAVHWDVVVWQTWWLLLLLTDNGGAAVQCSLQKVCIIYYNWNLINISPFQNLFCMCADVEVEIMQIPLKFENFVALHAPWWNLNSLCVFWWLPLELWMWCFSLSLFIDIH